MRCRIGWASSSSPHRPDEQLEYPIPPGRSFPARLRRTEFPAERISRLHEWIPRIRFSNPDHRLADVQLSSQDGQVRIGHQRLIECIAQGNWRSCGIRGGLARAGSGSDGRRLCTGDVFHLGKSSRFGFSKRIGCRTWTGQRRRDAPGTCSRRTRRGNIALGRGFRATLNDPRNLPLVDESGSMRLMERDTVVYPVLCFGNRQEQGRTASWQKSPPANGAWTE